MESVTRTMQQKILRLRSLYEERGLPEEWLYDILKDIHIWSVYSLRHGGTYSIPDHLGEWFDLIFSGKMLRIGRLQYCKSQFGGKILVFRRGEEIAVLAEDGLTFDDRGLRAENGWKSVLQCYDGRWEGNRIRNGKAEKERVMLKADEWEIVLRCYDPMISIHIPEDGPLDIEDCKASLETAAQWFGRHDQDWKGFFCQSWLLNPVFQEILPGDSNIIQFQQLGRLYPMISETDILARIYPGKLREFVEEYQAKGQVFRSGGMFFLKSDVSMLKTEKGN